jgi:7-cyano-7-deazaguanine reductase
MLSKLGSGQTKYEYQQPQTSMLETFDNKHPDRDYLVTHDCFEYTSLCPITGQPDFATIQIRLIPDKLCVETKSLKLYLFAFRNEGMFMEDSVNRIFNDLWAVMLPRSMTVQATFKSRGGIQTSVQVSRSQEAHETTPNG